MDRPASHPAAAPGPARDHPRTHGGGWRLALLLFGAVLFPGLILVASAATSWRWVAAEAERDLTVAADAASEFVLRVVEGHARLADRIGESLADQDEATVLAAADDLRWRIGRYIADLPLVQAAVVAGADGSVLVWAGRPAAPGDSPRDLELPGLVAVDPDTLVSQAFRMAGQGATTFAIARRWAPAGGVVALLIDVSRMNGGLRRVVGDAGDSAAIMRRDGHIIARVPGFDTPPPPLGPDRPLLAALAEGRTRGLIEGVTPRDGKPVLLGFRVIENTPGLITAIARPRTTITARWWSTVFPLAAVTVPAMLSLAGLAWMVRARQHALEATLTGLEQRIVERTASLREGEERLRLAVAAGQIGIWETDLRSGLTIRSPHAIAIMGLSEAASVSAVETWAARIHPDDRTRVLAAWERTSSGQQGAYREEYRFLRPDGAWRWIESTAAAVRLDPATDKPTRIAGTMRDITEQREAEERRELLTQEVNHRARNTLAVMQAILRLTRAKDAAGYAKLVEGRIAALARAQSLLAAERWTGAPLRTVLADELAAFGGPDAPSGEGNSRFVLTGVPLRIKPEAVQPLGMVFHELATNAAKHGALSREGGQVAVDWHIDEDAGLLCLHWVESGGPSPGPPSHRGFGSRVVEATVTGQLGGSIVRRWLDAGLVCDITIPLGRARAGPA